MTHTCSQTHPAHSFYLNFHLNFHCHLLIPCPLGWVLLHPLGTLLFLPGTTVSSLSQGWWEATKLTVFCWTVRIAGHLGKGGMFPQKQSLRQGFGCRWFIWEVLLESRVKECKDEMEGRKDSSRISYSGHQCEKQGLVQSQRMSPKPPSWRRDGYFQCPWVRENNDSPAFLGNCMQAKRTPTESEKAPQSRCQKMTKYIWVPQEGSPQLQLKIEVGRREGMWGQRPLSYSPPFMLRSVGRVSKTQYGSQRPSMVFRQVSLYSFSL